MGKNQSTASQSIAELDDGGSPASSSLVDSEEAKAPPVKAVQDWIL